MAQRQRASGPETTQSQKKLRHGEPRGTKGGGNEERKGQPNLFINRLYRFQAVMVVTRSPFSVQGVVDDLHALAVAHHTHVIPQDRTVL